jgi:hypothetical protein
LSNLFRRKQGTEEEMYTRVISLSTHAFETLQRNCYTLGCVDTSVFQENNIFRPIRESLGWNERDGWSKGLNYRTTEEKVRHWREITIHAFRWLDTHGLVHFIDGKWVLISPSGITAPAFEWLPSFEIPDRFLSRILNSFLAQKLWDKAYRMYQYIPTDDEA